MWAFAVDVERHLRGREHDVVLGLGKTWTHDVIRTGGGSHQTFVQQAARFSRGRWERMFGAGRIKDHLALRIERRAFAPGNYSRVIANSEMVKHDVVARYGVPEERIEVIYNGVDLERFHPRLRDLVVSFVGKGFGRKGLERLLLALPEVTALHPELRLLVAGRDSAQRDYQRLACDLRVDEHVRFLGERRDPERVYAASDLSILPTHYDSFAFSVLEAMACGVPVITTDRAGASELVEPELGEVLAGDCGPEAIAGALLDWCDRDRARAAGRAAREKAEGYGVPATLEATERVLLEAASARPRGAARS
jgi:UDP-glucose:(heptosyl)LPS alpha-1,3-glucosyltransferase